MVKPCFSMRVDEVDHRAVEVGDAHPVDDHGRRRRSRWSRRRRGCARRRTAGSADPSSRPAARRSAAARSSRPSWSRRLFTLAAATALRLIWSVRRSSVVSTCSVMWLAPVVSIGVSVRSNSFQWSHIRGYSPPSRGSVETASSAGPGARHPRGQVGHGARRVAERPLLPHQRRPGSTPTRRPGRASRGTRPAPARRSPRTAAAPPRRSRRRRTAPCRSGWRSRRHPHRSAPGRPAGRARRARPASATSSIPDSRRPPRTSSA